jgi:hypothetical protein
MWESLVARVRQSDTRSARPVELRSAGMFSMNADEPVRVRVGQWLQQHRVDDTEDRGVGADTEGEREDGHAREARIAHEHPERESHVPTHVNEKSRE